MFPTFVFESKPNQSQTVTSVITDYGIVCWSRMWPFVNNMLACIRRLDLFAPKENDLEDWVFIQGNASQNGSTSWTAVVGPERETNDKPRPVERGVSDSTTTPDISELAMVDVDLSEPSEMPLEFD
ncbi:uncharacterized protein LOC121390774 [Gigantopelta aegis]|uniref:uncharacterized protein LOC121390774 n=1 Tax=Gigantopelta aegis TaxID=1735272 RepID=UPI001B88E0D5|nr:uncharacterized protein LOC121390774 [Gigantopelta aegis]